MQSLENPCFHPDDMLPANINTEHRTEAVPPHSNRLMADIDPAPEE